MCVFLSPGVGSVYIDRVTLSVPIFYLCNYISIINWKSVGRYASYSWYFIFQNNFIPLYLFSSRTTIWYWTRSQHKISSQSGMRGSLLLCIQHTVPRNGLWGLTSYCTLLLRCTVVMISLGRQKRELHVGLTLVYVMCIFFVCLFIFFYFSMFCMSKLFSWSETI